jgi:hypothetical protein
MAGLFLPGGEGPSLRLSGIQRAELNMGGLEAGSSKTEFIVVAWPTMWRKSQFRHHAGATRAKHAGTQFRLVVRGQATAPATWLAIAKYCGIPLRPQFSGNLGM